jgi:hypothetical protein
LTTTPRYSKGVSATGDSRIRRKAGEMEAEMRLGLPSSCSCMEGKCRLSGLSPNVLTSMFHWPVPHVRHVRRICPSWLGCEPEPDMLAQRICLTGWSRELVPACVGEVTFRDCQLSDHGVPPRQIAIDAFNPTWCVASRCLATILTHQMSLSCKFELVVEFVLNV